MAAMRFVCEDLCEMRLLCLIGLCAVRLLNGCLIVMSHIYVFVVLQLALF